MCTTTDMDIIKRRPETWTYIDHTHEHTHEHTHANTRSLSAHACHVLMSSPSQPCQHAGACPCWHERERIRICTNTRAAIAPVHACDSLSLSLSLSFSLSLPGPANQRRCSPLAPPCRRRCCPPPGQIGWSTMQAVQQPTKWQVDNEQA